MNRKQWRALQDSNLWPAAPEARERRANLLHTVKLRGT